MLSLGFLPADQKEASGTLEVRLRIQHSLIRSITRKSSASYKTEVTASSTAYILKSHWNPSCKTCFLYRSRL